jgi:hypothetical protein
MTKTLVGHQYAGWGREGYCFSHDQTYDPTKNPSY